MCKKPQGYIITKSDCVVTIKDLATSECFYVQSVSNVTTSSATINTGTGILNLDSSCSNIADMKAFFDAWMAECSNAGGVNGDVTVTANVDFAPVITAIADLSAEIKAVCEKLEADAETQGDIIAELQALCDKILAGNQADATATAALIAELQSLCDKILDGNEAEVASDLAILECLKEIKDLQIKNRYTIKETCEYIHVDDQKKDNPQTIKTIVYEDCDTDPPTLIEVEVGQPIENIFNSENYIKMSNFAGLPPSLPASKTAEKTLEICGPNATGTIRDVLDAAVAAGVLIDGVAPDGIIAMEIIGEYKGQQCAGTTLTSNGPTIYGAEPSLVSIDGGQKFCEALKYADEDCDGLADACYDLTTPLVIPAGAGVIVNVKLALCDDDPTTPATEEK